MSAVLGCGSGGRSGATKDLPPEPNPDEDTPPPLTSPPAGKTTSPSPAPPANGGTDAAVAGGTGGGGGAGGEPPGNPPPGDGGAGDRARATADAGPLAAEPCKYLLCESFETLADGPYPAGRAFRATAPARMVVDSTRGARGSKKSLHVTTPSGPSETYLRESTSFAQAPATFYGRLYAYVEKAPNAFVHWTVVEGRGADGRKAIRYGATGSGGNYSILFNIETHSGAGEKGLGGGGGFSLRAWHCVEWFYDATKSEARLWIDGQERGAVHYQNNYGATYAFPNPFTNLFIGWGIYQQAEAGYDVSMDEIVIDKDRVGCD